jgi:hypothetical protein
LNCRRQMRQETRVFTAKKVVLLRQQCLLVLGCGMWNKDRVEFQTAKVVRETTPLSPAKSLVKVLSHSKASRRVWQIGKKQFDQVSLKS